MFLLIELSPYVQVGCFWTVVSFANSLNFDQFRNSLRAKVFFSHGHHLPPADVAAMNPAKKKSSWRPPKCSLVEVETFLNKVEGDLFSHTGCRAVDDNLSVHERTALSEWRKEHLFNTEDDLVIRQQDKGNRFVVVDKATDIEKAVVQIGKSSFRELSSDPTSDYIELVRKWSDKWFKKNAIDKVWKDFVVNELAQPGKNTPLYKTHKTGTPVRLLTTGCNTAIENLSKFLEFHSAPLAAEE